MTIYWTDADVSHLSQMSHLHSSGCPPLTFFSKKFAKKFAKPKQFIVSLHRILKNKCDRG